MTGSIMTLRTALPGMAAGTVGLMGGVLGVAADQPLFGLIAGGLALAAGATNLVLARRLEDVMALNVLIDSELGTNRRLTADTTADVDTVTEQGRRGGETSDLVLDAGPAQPPTIVTNGDTIDGPARDTVDGPARDAVDGPARDASDTGDSAGGTDRGDDTDALLDRSTGLFSETFFRVALESRIAAARRHLRPISVVLLDVVEGLPSGHPQRIDPDLVSAAIGSTLREADTACRLRTGYFALLLEDTPENGAIWTVERIRRHLGELRDGLTVWAGVACYPAHAFTPNEILTASEQALVAAREWRQDRIEVAVAAD